MVPVRTDAYQDEDGFGGIATTVICLIFVIIRSFYRFLSSSSYRFLSSSSSRSFVLCKFHVFLLSLLGKCVLERILDYSRHDTQLYSRTDFLVRAVYACLR